ncbi:unnamed protein product [Prunus armeniaca]
MDAYSGYNQIFMDPADSEHTAFITDRGLYCYNVMPFGLKNAGATYQRLVNRIFAKHIGGIMEVYVDDMLVKNRAAGGASGKPSPHVRYTKGPSNEVEPNEVRLRCIFG